MSKTSCFLLLLLLLRYPAAAGLLVNQLTCEQVVNPVGIDAANPVLGWQLNSDLADARQTAYEVRVAASVAAMVSGENLLWSSGKIASGQFTGIRYEGKPLKSGLRYYWQVRIWDDHGNNAAWSRNAFWQMGLLTRQDWQAQWIAPDSNLNGNTHTNILFRKSFDCKTRVKAAFAYIAVSGAYAATINGRNLSDNPLNQYGINKSNGTAYQTYDITSLLQQGANVIAFNTVMSGSIKPGNIANAAVNKTNLPGVLCQISLRYEDGSEELVITDNSWKATAGPLLYAAGASSAVYKAGNEQAGWEKAGFAVTSWDRVTAFSPDDSIVLKALFLPVCSLEHIQPVKTTRQSATVYYLDFGRPVTGWVQFDVNGKTGDHLNISVAAGNTPKSGQQIKAGDRIGSYILKGGGAETFTPLFMLNHFRYIRVECTPGGLMNTVHFTGVAITPEPKLPG